MSLIASPSSFPSRNYKFNIFASFHGPDVRKTLLSHIREDFKRNGITMFNDQDIERSATIAPSLTKAIRESRISIVILSKKYASSSWCLDELVEILQCQKSMGQIVMTIFYGVDPSDVRKQTGEFGIAFSETCKHKTDEERQKWSKALKEVGNIAGEDFFRWDNEANMIKKIARDVSNKLNATPSRDSDGMVGLEAHLKEIQSLLDINDKGVKMVAITGPAGIGKTTIAKALLSQLSDMFQLTCFVDNLRESNHSGLDKLPLQEQFLSKVLKQDGLRIHHSSVIEERLCDQRVLIILDDVNNIMQLEALANETTWFGPGSRIIVTTENKELLQQHGINNTYHVRFPSHVDAIEILCKYAFRQSQPHSGFKEQAERVTELCGNLPLGLRVVGSSLRGKNEDEWEEKIRRLETILDYQDIEKILRVGFESLHENEKSLFLHIAVFFNYKDGALVNAMFADTNNNLDIKHGLEILANRSLIFISTKGDIVMHKLLQQVGTKIVHEDEPWKRRILIDAQDICDVLENAEGGTSRQVSGILFDTSGIDELFISKKAFKRMSKLWFLIVYKSKDDGNDRMHIPEGMEFPRRLRLLDWEAYPSKCLPSRFSPEYLVELNMSNSKLEKLWEGTPLFKNLKKIDLKDSYDLKELPDLSNATNLETLKLSYCKSLVEIPPSFSHLHKLRKLKMANCINLQVIPADMKLTSLEHVNMERCLKLRTFPVLSMNIKHLNVSETAVEEVPTSISLCSQLIHLYLNDNGKLKGITHLPPNILSLNLSYSHIEKIPDCMKAFHQLHELDLSGCKRLTSLPALPGSLINLDADYCDSLETVFSHLNRTPEAMLSFINCFKLGQQARRAIIRGSCFRGSALLPGRQVPAEFDHREVKFNQRTRVTSLTIPLSCFTRFMVCLVISPHHQNRESARSHLLCCRICKNDLYPVGTDFYIGNVPKYRAEHLFIFHSRLLEKYINPSEVTREIELEFSCQSYIFDIVECGAKIWTQGSYESELEQVFEDDIVEFETSEEVDETNIEDELTDGVICDSIEDEKHIYCWSWLFLCFSLGKKTIESGSQ
ncbi:Disease resistance protein RML1B [Cardamine amara subsp. amara]|uniref:ADP-ribosyl cyclase/cyclic ADP-ribose hydrolase n=1 Tax=Cardamine amara subsp. amara TaxID=228776 RepID=A0ABD0ZAE9_CARAN